MIKIEALHKSFGPLKVLQGVDLELNKPGITAILGPNGSGKTTLIKSILGMVLPQSGTIHFQGDNIQNKFEYRRAISHLPQIAHFPENLTARELISMIKDIRGNTTKEGEIVEMFNLESELGKKLGTLSGGNKQKINLMLALMYDNPFLILDEPSTGLDPVAMMNLKIFLKKEASKRKHIIITTHIMSFVEDVAENIIFLLEGQIFFNGKMTELLNLQGETRLENAIAKILKS